MDKEEVITTPLDPESPTVKTAKAKKRGEFPHYLGPMPCPLIKFPGDPEPYRARYMTWEQVDRYLQYEPQNAVWWE